ncbi:DUF4422 domain-containing protein [Aggregatibacter actinomycetemcomitans]|nr:DUF4422 domain-containing protein [Aggregatibacter actinomycetemcomitans]
MSTLKILIATHKKYEFPNTSYYVPIHVGKNLTHIDLNILSDNTQDNISNKNQSYCELTALYWAWKNNFFADMEYVGLVHYRRYFAGNELLLKGKRIASSEELAILLKDVDCLVPRKRNYYIETVYSHYQHAHYIEDLKAVGQILANKYPDYLTSFERVMQGKTLYLYNMFVIKRELFESYCHWLFTILFELEATLDVSNYNPYQKRVYGFLAERLFNVWLLKNEVRLKEVRVVSLERQNILLKGISFIKRKLMGRKE